MFSAIALLTGNGFFAERVYPRSFAFLKYAFLKIFEFFGSARSERYVEMCVEAKPTLAFCWVCGFISTNRISNGSLIDF